MKINKYKEKCLINNMTYKTVGTNFTDINNGAINAINNILDTLPEMQSQIIKIDALYDYAFSFAELKYDSKEFKERLNTYIDQNCLSNEIMKNFFNQLEKILIYTNKEIEKI